MFRKGEVGRTVGAVSAATVLFIGGAVAGRSVFHDQPAAGGQTQPWRQYPQSGHLRTAVCIDYAKPVLPKGTELCVNDNIYGTGLFSADPEARFLQSLIIVHDPDSGVRDADTGRVDPATEDTCYQTVPGVTQQWRICERLGSDGSYRFVPAKPEPLTMPR